MPRAPPADGVALPHAEGVAARVVPVHLVRVRVRGGVRVRVGG